MTRPSGVPAWPDLPAGTVAVGWATVDIDRASAELASLVADGVAFTDTGPSPTLGARCRVGRASAPRGDLAVVLLEPATEGRLAAYLARFGEGWAAVWHSEPVGAGPAPRTSFRTGPIGLERLADDGQPAGPFRLLVETATIAP